MARAAVLAAFAIAAPARAQFPDVLSETECPGCAAALRSADAQLAARALFSGTWSTALTSASDPAWTPEDFSCFVACTPETRSRAAAPSRDPAHPHDDEAQLFRFACDPRGLAAQVVSPLPLRIEQQPGRIVLRYEEFGAERAVPIGVHLQPATTGASLLGVSTGRFEDGALVIETRGIAAQRVYGWFEGRPHSDQLRATERYTTSRDGAWLYLVLELDDPTLDKPLILTKRWRRVPGAEIAPYGCDVLSGQLEGVFAEYVDPKIVEERRRAWSTPRLTTSNDGRRPDAPPSRLAGMAADPDSRR